ncbi:hypothetical protein A2U01_0073084, partial [Trifolium medium]|nr:hypothetical protein [Trifolium medium]
FVVGGGPVLASPEVRVLLCGVLFLFLVVIATNLRSVVVVVRFRRCRRLVFLSVVFCSWW